MLFSLCLGNNIIQNVLILYKFISTIFSYRIKKNYLNKILNFCIKENIEIFSEIISILKQEKYFQIIKFFLQKWDVHA